MSPVSHPVASEIEERFGVTLDPGAVESLHRACPVTTFAGPGPMLGATLPPDFWSHVADTLGPFLQYLLTVLLGKVPVTSLGAGETLAEALPANFWVNLVSLVGPVLVSVVKSLFAKVPNPA